MGRTDAVSEQASQLLTSLMGLSEIDRASIAECLLDTLSTNTEDLSIEDFERELDERVEEYRRNPSDAIPWTQLRDE